MRDLGRKETVAGLKRYQYPAQGLAISLFDKAVTEETGCSRGQEERDGMKKDI